MDVIFDANGFYCSLSKRSLVKNENKIYYYCNPRIKRIKLQGKVQICNTRIKRIELQGKVQISFLLPCFAQKMSYLEHNSKTIRIRATKDTCTERKASLNMAFNCSKQTLNVLPVTLSSNNSPMQAIIPRFCPKAKATFLVLTYKLSMHRRRLGNQNICYHRLQHTLIFYVP